MKRNTRLIMLIIIVTLHLLEYWGKRCTALPFQKVEIRLKRVLRSINSEVADTWMDSWMDSSKFRKYLDVRS
jgi:hypothetical protein